MKGQLVDAAVLQKKSTEAAAAHNPATVKAHINNSTGNNRAHATRVVGIQQPRRGNNN